MEIATIIKTGFRRPATRFVTLALFVALVSAVVLFPRVKQTKFHGDESGWISSGRYYTDLLSQGNFEWEKWECKECGDWGSLNMQLGKLLIGIPLELDPQVRSQAFSRYYKFEASFEENVQQGLVPPQETLTRARRASATFGVFCCVLVFAIGYCAYNAFAGVLSAILLLCNRLFVNQATRAMTDVHYNFFLLCACLAVIFFVRASTKKNALTMSAVCGVFAGLACAVKCTGIVIGTGLFVFALATQRIWFAKRSLKEILSLLGLFGLSALIVDYVLNPYFWPSLPALSDPAAAQELRSYVSEAAESKSLPRQVRTRYPHFGTITRVLEFPHQFHRFKNFMSWAANTPLNSRPFDNRILSLNHDLFVRHLFPRAVWRAVLFLAVGICFVVGKWQPELSGLTDPARLVPLQWFLVNYLFILNFMILNWDRYYLPTVISAMPLMALGIYGTCLWLYRYLSAQWLKQSFILQKITKVTKVDRG